MPRELHRGHLRIGDGDPRGILSAVELGADVQAAAAPRRADQTHDRGEVHERRAAPVHRNVREEAMLELVPLAGAGRKVTDRDRQPGAVGQLQLCLLKSRHEDGTLSLEASNPRAIPRGTPYRSRDRGHRQYITATQTC